MKPQKFRSMLYVPGNNPGMVQQATIYGADSVLLDLEDSVDPEEKDAAREIVKSLIPLLDRSQCVLTVRINNMGTDLGKLDLEAIVPLAVDAIRIPKTESVEQIQEADKLMTELEAKYGLSKKTDIHAMIETTKGVVNVFDIVRASPRIKALTFGAQDLLADMGLRRVDYNALSFAKGQVILAAKLAKIYILDTPFIDVDDDKGLFENATQAKSLGFTGKAAINPRQIDIINLAFTPSCEEVEYAKKVVSAFNAFKKMGTGVFAIDGKMVDKPVVAQSTNVLNLVDIDPNSL